MSKEWKVYMKQQFMWMIISWFLLGSYILMEVQQTSHLGKLKVESPLFLAPMALLGEVYEGIIIVAICQLHPHVFTVGSKVI